VTVDELESAIRETIAETAQGEKRATRLVLLEILIRLRPDTGFYRLSYAESLRMVGRCREAEEAYLTVTEDALSEDARFLLPLDLGRLYRDTGDYARAEACFSRSVELAPWSTVPFVHLGGLLRMQGRLSEARAVLERGMNASGDVDEVLLNLGHCFRGLNQLQEARRCYRKALSLTPDYSEAQVALEDVELAARTQVDFDAMLLSVKEQ